MGQGDSWYRKRDKDFRVLEDVVWVVWVNNESRMFMKGYQFFFQFEMISGINVFQMELIIMFFIRGIGDRFLIIVFGKGIEVFIFCINVYENQEGEGQYLKEYWVGNKEVVNVFCGFG